MIDVFLATLLGYYARAGSEPTTNSSPHLWSPPTFYGDTVAELAQRRPGWWAAAARAAPVRGPQVGPQLPLSRLRC